MQLAGSLALGPALRLLGTVPCPGPSPWDEAIHPRAGRIPGPTAAVPPASGRREYRGFARLNCQSRAALSRGRPVPGPVREW